MLFFSWLALQSLQKFWNVAVAAEMEIMQRGEKCLPLPSVLLRNN